MKEKVNEVLTKQVTEPREKRTMTAMMLKVARETVRHVSV